MRESFSKPLSKKEISKDIKSEMEEYLRKKKEGFKDEGVEVAFNQEIAENPLSRREMDEDVEYFIRENISTFASIVYNQKAGKSLDAFKVLNKNLRDFGFEDSSITSALGVSELDEEESESNLAEVYYSAVGDDRYKAISEILAAAYLKEEIIIDSRLHSGNSISGHPQRYFYNNLKRYLCKNDYGMKQFGGAADVSIIKPFSQSVHRRIRQALSNIETIKESVIGSNLSANQYFIDLKKQLELKYEIPRALLGNNPNHGRINRRRQELFKLVYDEVENAKRAKFAEVLGREEIQDLVIKAIPAAKAIHEIGLKSNRSIDNLINEDLGEEADLWKKLEYCQSKKFQEKAKELIIRNTYSLPDLEGKVIATSVVHGRPVILGNEEMEHFLDKAKDGYVDRIEREIIDSDSDERLKTLSYNTTCGRGLNSPHYFKPFDVYKSVKKIGVEKFLEMIPEAEKAIAIGNEERNNENVYINTYLKKFFEGVDEIHKIFGDNIRKMDNDKIKKEIWSNSALNERGVWLYFAEKVIGEGPSRVTINSRERGPQARFRRDRQNEFQKLEKEHSSQIRLYLDNLSQAEKQKLFFKGKQMNWLAKQIHQKSWEIKQDLEGQLGEVQDVADEEQEGFKFSPYLGEINWKQYDVDGADITKLSKYLITHGRMICSFLYVGKGDRNKAVDINLKDVMSVVEALEDGLDLRGLPLAYDKKRYIDKLLSDPKKERDIEYALEDWPSELRKNVSSDEFKIYFENAEEYLFENPNGILKYAKLLQKNSKIRDVFAERIEKKSDLDFRFCIIAQSDLVKDWYLDAAAYIGNSSLQRYIVRFQATRVASGAYASLHDALYWIPNVKRVEPHEAISLLDNITTVDESRDFRDYLSRYDKELDGLRKDGPIKSLRELKKRVSVLESNVDFSAFPPEVVDIVSAPGFNISSLQNLNKEPRFKDLVTGKMDEGQPFRAHKRKFTAQSMNELLKEGLGSFKEKIKGTAHDPKKLFDSIRQMIRGKEVEGREMQIQDLLKNVPLDMEDEILKLLQKHKVAVGPILEATVHDKSDPEGWVCGNYTDCCMPFGDYKNTDYMFNEGTQYFTVKYNGRIIAQSVVVDASNKLTNEDVIILDNIEIANNYKNRAALLSKIYRVFWSEYTSKKVKIGTGHSDLIPIGAKFEPNHYKPKHSLSYSDSSGSQILNLPKIEGVEAIDKILTFSNIEERDADLIFEMEKAVYPEGMVQGKGEVLEVIKKTRELELPGATSSFIARQGNEAAGYLLVLPESSMVNKEETVAHIYDMAVLPKFQDGKIARKIMERMLDIAVAYDVPAIEFEARESTSYRLLSNCRILKWIESKGFKLSYNEKLPEYIGGEDFYFVRLERIGLE